MSFETNVASAILGRVGQVEVPELYTANAQFGGTLQSVFVPGSYGGQSHQYGDKGWFSLPELSASLSKYKGHPLGYQPAALHSHNRFDERSRPNSGHLYDSLVERLALSPQPTYTLQ